MNSILNNWGINIIGRKMRYEPWATDTNGTYRIPTQNEIEEVYGISGEAINETILYFEECGGDFQKVVELLNEHVINIYYQITREELLNKTRWYTNEYYFYFIMFTKKVIGDYNWRFIRDEKKQLSIHHKIYEIGFLKYNPYGKEEKDDTFSVIFALMKYYSAKEYDFSDLLLWGEYLVKEKTSISFKDVVSKLENYWLCSEFNNFLYEFAKIILNKNNMITVCHEAFDLYDLQGFSYAPELMLIKIIIFVTQKTTNFYHIIVKQTKKNSASFILEISKKYDRNKDNIYQKSIYKNANSITIGAYPQIIKKLLKLSKMPEVKNITGIDSDYCNFLIEWEKRINIIPVLQLLINNSLASIFLAANHFLNWNIFSQILIVFFSINIILILLRNIKIEKMKRKISDENILKANEENRSRLEKLEELSNALMIEKNALKQKVMERTGKLAEVNEKLKKIDIAKTNFFANISHELRTPLTLIVSPLNEILKGSYGTNINKNNPIFETMKKNSSRLLNLISNILSITKIEEDKMTLNNEVVDISKALKIYISQIESAVKNKGLFLKYIDNSNGIIALIDQNLFETAIFNLLSNALKFTEKGGITVKLEREDNAYFTISISDTGIGIPDDKKDFIFERFRQIDENSNRKYEGSGIGLALTKEIIDIFEGKIIVESKLNEGSAFKIVLPINIDLKNNKSVKIKETNPVILDEFKNKNDNEKDNIHGIKNKTKKTILLVEDNIDLQNYIYSALKDKNNIEIASNGVEALDKIKSIKKPALIISDIMMPEMDGNELYKKIQDLNNYKDIPFIFLSARVDHDEKIKSLESGAIDYICKPFNIDELVLKIENIISKTESIKDSYKSEIHKKILNLIDEENKDEKFTEISIEIKLKEYSLSTREKEIVLLLLKGDETKKIASKLKINSHTVENHITSIYKKIGVSNKIELFNLFNKD